MTRERFLPGPRTPLDRHDPWAGIEARSYSLLATVDPQGYPQAPVDGPGPRRLNGRLNLMTFTMWPRGLRGRAWGSWRTYEVRRKAGVA